MDDTAQKGNTPVVTNQDQPVQSVQNATVQQPSVQPQPVMQPVSVPAGKETAPALVTPPKEQWIAEHAPLAEVPQGLKEVGVEPVKREENVEVPPEVAQAGVTPVGMAAPIPTTPTIKLPMTEEKAKQVLSKHGRWKLSIAWMAMLVMRQLNVLQFTKEKEEKKK